MVSGIARKQSRNSMITLDKRPDGGTKGDALVSRSSVFGRPGSIPGPAISPGWRNLVDAPDLGSGVLGRAGSIPVPGIYGAVMKGEAAWL